MNRYIGFKNWNLKAALIIGIKINKILKHKNRCNIFLTGGRTAEGVYKELAKLSIFIRNLPSIYFYFGDERAINIRSAESNYGMVINTLFNKGSLDSVGGIFRIEADHSDLDLIAEQYENLIPDEIDIVLLGVGFDGHIASIFPESDGINSIKKIIKVSANQSGNLDRISITRKVIESANHIYILANNKNKVFEVALLEPENKEQFPARIVLDDCWILN